MIFTKELSRVLKIRYVILLLVDAPAFLLYLVLELPVVRTGSYYLLYFLLFLAATLV